eukprot:gnl/TRDRNA2_/TRDRNA2_178865_c0_seq1.p1 gnl/TRDRNA2_/TRDRNA2_178865_c0~~gnl/TRDRNA2_/TRDRNA2_178865_c0_seq1.p1  ORF type:complete len:299 (-),score=66.92 gnl/TRDRNA2_/TRDRNA2_178865_c0_seq1:100-942(-)
MFGGGNMFVLGTSTTSQPGAPDKRARQEEKQTCMPVTVRILETALDHKAGGEEIRIHGQEAGQLILVGAVESLVRQAASLEFTLNDATGRIRTRYFMQGSADDADLERLVVGEYVHVVGTLRTAPTTHIGVLWLRKVDGADAVSYHMIEAAYAAHKIQKGSFGSTMTQDPQTPAHKASFEKVSPEKQSMPVPIEDLGSTNTFAPAPTAVAPKALLHGDALRQAVIEFLRQEGDEVVGVGFAALSRHLQSVSTKDLRGCIEKLIQEGEIFSTIDDDHFNLM